MNRLLLAALALGALPVAQAEDCRLNLSESRLDFGVMNRTIHRAPSAETLLGERRLSLTINCPQPSDMSLFYRALAGHGERFRFTDRGSYEVQVSDAVLDGQAVELGLIAGQGQAPGTRANVLAWRPDQGIVPLRDGVPATGSAFSVQLLVNAWAQADATLVRDAVTWETSGLFDAVGTGQARELTLQAGFAPAACTANLSNGGIVDFGRMWAKSLNADKENALASRSLMLGIGCDGPTRFTLRMQDNRNGTATGGTDETAYGLGVDNSRNNIGRYYLYFDPFDLQADTLPQVYRTDSTTNGVAWSSSSAYPIPIGSNSLLGFTDTPGSHAGPTAIQNLNGQISVRAILAPMNTLDLSTEVLLDGSGTIEILYL
ncbi:DUF1120 domain-containing protein [Pseudomonas yamanorum]|uniref:DUF1120 domain-containing protein n=1 Tax=Pseudomonas yamanorum TaxID=515393 RepID=A0A7Y8EML0_9PSED|nr:MULTISPECIES: DUF1120 domain-containing protein [Pseudomonas]MCS3419267.1 hypothetical protein [Pseudomonas sp. BIGb0558]MCS3438849.1 hypothetical protein [Pseudomonas sp. BIGb0450]NWE17422.1 DUF1120 domain-containing protein [Pseudomonas yamanorum]NWE37907.1 DUF1120 domain-containing protein [Pseudomonas yamanorum]